MTRPNPAQLIGGVLLCAVVAFLSVDLLHALGAQPCPGGPNCYPWGAEGPVAGVWSYASKSNYLIRGFAQLALFIGVGLFLIRAAGRDRALSGFGRAGAGTGLVAALLLFLI